MRVLVACEFSEVVKEQFLLRGHDAHSCDLLSGDKGLPNHHQCDVRELLNDYWDMMIAHPPCTFLCGGGTANIYRKDRQEWHWRENRVKAFDFVMELANAPIERIAIENPIGYLNTAWRKPDQILRPYMFGHPYKKDICFWLKNLPLLNPTYALFPPKPYKKLDFWSTARNPNGRSLKSITFKGLAEAMAEQWGNL